MLPGQGWSTVPPVLLAAFALSWGRADRPVFRRFCLGLTPNGLPCRFPCPAAGGGRALARERSVSGPRDES